MTKVCLVFLCLCFQLSGPALAQTSIGVKFFGLSVHPQGDENAFLMPNKVDPKGVLVLNLGAIVSYERFFADRKLSLKAVQAGYADCAAQAAGFSHVGIRGRIFEYKRSSLYGGIGPTIVYRRNWSKLPGYRDPGYFDGSADDELQYKFLWYGGELEYSYNMNDRYALAATFIPGYPKLMNVSVGLKFL